ncbi:hypothetical protein Bca4012_058972 [Brassica carinata]
MKAHGDNMPEEYLVSKVLSSLTTKYDPYVGEEGILDLEEDDELPQPLRFQSHTPAKVVVEESRGKSCCKEEVKVEDADENDEDGEFTDSGCESEKEGDEKCVGKQEQRIVERHQVYPCMYVNRRPTTMNEVIKDLEDQSTTICDVAKEVSGLLEASRAQYAPSSSVHSTMKKLKPVALFRSGSSRSSSSRFLLTSSSGGFKESGSESRSDASNFSHGRRNTTMNLENVLEEHTRRNACSLGIKMIETLHDQELLPQLLELVQGLTRMWQVMAESHQIQRRTLDEATMLLVRTPVSKRHKKRQQQPPIMP